MNTLKTILITLFISFFVFEASAQKKPKQGTKKKTDSEKVTTPELSAKKALIDKMCGQIEKVMLAANKNFDSVKGEEHTLNDFMKTKFWDSKVTVDGFSNQQIQTGMQGTIFTAEYYRGADTAAASQIFRDLVADISMCNTFGILKGQNGFNAGIIKEYEYTVDSVSAGHDPRLKNVLLTVKKVSGMLDPDTVVSITVRKK